MAVEQAPVTPLSSLFSAGAASRTLGGLLLRVAGKIALWMTQLPRAASSHHGAGTESPIIFNGQGTLIHVVTFLFQ